ncbi:BTB/POZ domain [Trinorchestia longiramus]|nr:BTB/POZ domain [Trinorchestia longiramus]
MARNSPTREELTKVQQHLALLRDQYTLLQEKCSQLQQERDVAQAAAGCADGFTSFASRLLAFVSKLHNKEEYSDVTIKVSDTKNLKAHKFVLQARSSKWETLKPNETLDWSSLGEGVGEAVLQWVYSGELGHHPDTGFMISLMSAAADLALQHLLDRCEEEMVSRVTVKTCVKLYTTADEIGATRLRDHCSSLISTHWDDFTSEDFSHMSGPLLYAMFKSKTELPLHAAVRHCREDVIFLYLIEFRGQVGEGRASSKWADISRYGVVFVYQFECRESQGEVEVGGCL